MKFGYIFLFAISLSAVRAASVFRSSAENDVVLQPYNQEDRPVRGADKYTNAVRLTLMTNTVKPKSQKMCGGVRLIDGWILTAAECFDNPEHVFARVTTSGHYLFKGKFIKMEKESLSPRYRVLYKLHPEYNAKTKVNNIALVKTSPIFDADKDSVVHLPYVIEMNRTYENEKAFVSTYSNDRTTRESHVVRTNVTIHFGECPRVLPATPHVIEQTLCAMNAGSRTFTANDIGAPLVFQPNSFKRRKLIGVITFIGPATKGQAQKIEVTRIHPYLNWISLITNMPFKIDKDED